MLYDVLMIIAHQDDDALFGGVFQKAMSWLKWGIVCCTHDGNDIRKQELLAWQSYLGVNESDIYFLDYYTNPEDWRQLERGIDQCSIDYGEVANSIRKLDIKTKICLTHNEVGERSVVPKGHPHHKCVHKAVLESDVYEKIYTFGWGLENYYQNRKGYNLVIEIPEFVEEVKNIYKSQIRPISNIHDILDCCRRGIYLCLQS